MEVGKRDLRDRQTDRQTQRDRERLTNWTALHEDKGLDMNVCWEICTWAIQIMSNYWRKMSAKPSRVLFFRSFVFVESGFENHSDYFGRCCAVFVCFPFQPQKTLRNARTTKTLTLRCFILLFYFFFKELNQRLGLGLGSFLRGRGKKSQKIKK